MKSSHWLGATGLKRVWFAILLCFIVVGVGRVKIQKNRNASQN